MGRKVSLGEYLADQDARCPNHQVVYRRAGKPGHYHAVFVHNRTLVRRCVLTLANPWDKPWSRLSGIFVDPGRLPAAGISMEMAARRAISLSDDQIAGYESWTDLLEAEDLGSLIDTTMTKDRRNLYARWVAARRKPRGPLGLGVLG